MNCWTDGLLIVANILKYVSDTDFYTVNFVQTAFDTVVEKLYMVC